PSQRSGSASRPSARRVTSWRHSSAEWACWSSLRGCAIGILLRAPPHHEQWCEAHAADDLSFASFNSTLTSEGGRRARALVLARYGKFGHVLARASSPTYSFHSASVRLRGR